MSKLRVIFMGTPDFAVPCLEKLIGENYEIVGVITQPDRPKGRGRKLTPSPIKEIALKHNLTVYTPEKIKTPEFVNTLTALKPDIIVVVAFGQFLSKAILDLPPLGCINVHASLLPFYRGAAPIHWAIINGETCTGITTMYMDIGMDTGDMILKDTVAIGINDTTEDLHDKLKIKGADLLLKTIDLIVKHNAPRIPQDNDVATYASLLTRDIEHIDWKKSSVEIHNLIRGLNSWPGAYCLFQNKSLKVWRTAISSENFHSDVPGSIVSIHSGAITVQTGNGLLDLIEVQPESKRRISSADYIKGYGISVGEILG